MTKANHTPPPWDCTGCLFPDDGMGGVYYRLQADGMDARAANARLIAAAPELLELACQYLSDLRYPPTGDSLERRIERAKAVIAKATGAA